jgi:hypothetical protein
VNTPEAIKEKRSGKEWDPKTRKWGVRPSNALIEDSPVFAEARRRHNGNGNGASSSKSATAFPHYYAVLGVEVCTELFELHSAVCHTRRFSDKSRGSKPSSCSIICVNSYSKHRCTALDSSAAVCVQHDKARECCLTSSQLRSGQGTVRMCSIL